MTAPREEMPIVVDGAEYRLIGNVWYSVGTEDDEPWDEAVDADTAILLDEFVRLRAALAQAREEREAVEAVEEARKWYNLWEQDGGDLVLFGPMHEEIARGKTIIALGRAYRALEEHDVPLGDTEIRHDDVSFYLPTDRMHLALARWRGRWVATYTTIGGCRGTQLQSPPCRTPDSAVGMLSALMNGRAGEATP